ncbi:site-specific DNA-methyltransferase [Desulfuromonas carbonis]|uniref:site-specific DNA-methyltransferase n=1 Tax=Desulfuromonas sp. DDH964 TaxID=1823759 RepID=UPI00078D228A|nr:site-specific DNA-methyltransferase [Desulfuromonas sp. DDH964]AMV73399.1 DNA methyltransferase [Desulfuromonas sp. DDH964]
MPEKIDIRMSLASPNLKAKLLAELADAVPQVFSEGKIDFEKLKAALGEQIEQGVERYGLSWAGKSEAFRNVQISSVGTLRPMVEESVNWDDTENLIIEGDNLEVLKLLQKPYHGKVKMIYIDPPYNTGNEFIYPDNYREGLQDYLRYSGQVDEAGVKQSTNTETSGRFHSNWLNMMYPRLFLARNLLREDGVIFVSIDDHEVNNLRLLMDEVFGEENFVVQLTWKSRKYPDSRAKTGVSTDHEYVLVYCRAEAKLLGVERDESKFSNNDNDPRGLWMSRSLLGLANKKQRPNLHFPMEDPETGNIFEPPADTGWRYSKDRMQQLIDSKSILFPNKPGGRPREKKFREDMQADLIAFPSIIDDTYTADGTADIRSLFDFQIFDFSKPANLIKKLIKQGASEDSLILDFFAGSGTTAQAALELNKEDGGNRKFILVQLPEKTENKEYPTIAHITRERVRRVISNLNKENEEQLDFQGQQDRGFRSFKLDSSNFKIWDATQMPSTPEALSDQLKLYADNVERLRDQQDILYELILKSGLPLSSQIEGIEIGASTVWSVNGGQLLVCLERPVTQDVLREMIALKPEKLLCLDVAFDGEDKLKTNIVLEAQSYGVVFRTV